MEFNSFRYNVVRNFGSSISNYREYIPQTHEEESEYYSLFTEGVTDEFLESQISKFNNDGGSAAWSHFFVTRVFVNQEKGDIRLNIIIINGTVYVMPKGQNIEPLSSRTYSVDSSELLLAQDLLFKQSVERFRQKDKQHRSINIPEDALVAMAGEIQKRVQKYGIIPEDKGFQRRIMTDPTSFRGKTSM